MSGPANSLNITQSGYVVFDGVSVFTGRTFQAGSGITLSNATGIAGDTTITASGSVPLSFNGNTGTATPAANVLNIVTANATVKFVGSGSTLTQDFSLSNLVFGSTLPLVTSGANNLGAGQGVLGALTSGLNNLGWGNLTLQALSTGQGNTVAGYGAGRFMVSSLANSFFGLIAGSATLSSNNSAFGANSLAGHTTGAAGVGNNSAFGSGTLNQLQTGIENSVFGFNAGTTYTTSESSNICIKHTGVIGDSNTIRIGTQGSGVGNQNRAFLAGIVGVTNANAQTVTVDSTTGQLGVTTSLLTPATKVTTYTGSGSWTLDPRTVSIDVLIWSGGGGGASGRCGISAQAGSGCPGGRSRFLKTKLNPANLPASPYSITIGAGGTGAAAINATLQNGDPGGVGGTSSIGTAVLVDGPPSAPGGLTSTTGSVSSAQYLEFGPIQQTSTSAGGTASTPSNGAAQILAVSLAGAPGCGYTAATPRLGASSSFQTDMPGNTLVAGGTAGANTGGNGGNGNPPVSLPYLYVGGTGGGGGGHDGVTTAGSGGNGSAPGSGGGSGAGNLNLNNSGAGGNGGDGQIIIIEYF